MERGDQNRLIRNHFVWLLIKTEKLREIISGFNIINKNNWMLDNQNRFIRNNSNLQSVRILIRMFQNEWFTIKKRNFSRTWGRQVRSPCAPERLFPEIKRIKGKYNTWKLLGLHRIKDSRLESFPKTASCLFD